MGHLSLSMALSVPTDIPLTRRASAIAGISAVLMAVAAARALAADSGRQSPAVPQQRRRQRLNGNAWQQQMSPSPGGNSGSYLHVLGATSSANAWAVGNFSGASSLTLIERWNGKAWRHIPSPNT